MLFFVIFSNLRGFVSSSPPPPLSVLCFDWLLVRQCRQKKKSVEPQSNRYTHSCRRRFTALETRNTQETHIFGRLRPFPLCSLFLLLLLIFFLNAFLLLLLWNHSPNIWLFPPFFFSYISFTCSPKCLFPCVRLLLGFFFPWFFLQFSLLIAFFQLFSRPLPHYYFFVVPARFAFFVDFWFCSFVGSTVNENNNNRKKQKWQKKKSAFTKRSRSRFLIKRILTFSDESYCCSPLFFTNESDVIKSKRKPHSLKTQHIFFGSPLCSTFSLL